MALIFLFIPLTLCTQPILHFVLPEDELFLSPQGDNLDPKILVKL